MTSTNVVRFQAEDALYLHSNMIGAGIDDVLQEIYTAGSPDFSIINYKCLDWQVMAKPITAMKGNVYRFSLTNESNRVMNLNGLNWVATIMVFSEFRPLTLEMKAE